MAESLIPDDTTAHAILAIGGRAVVRGSSVAEISSGLAVLWTAGEEFGIEVLDEPFVFYQLESSALPVGTPWPLTRRSSIAVPIAEEPGALGVTERSVR